jgi:fibronectin-binding autotransporter adhesin
MSQRLSRTLGDGIVAAIAALFVCAVMAPAHAQITVGSDGSDTTDSTSYSGTQSLTKTGSNTVSLTGNNSYGATAINAGTLQIGAGGTNGTLGSGTVANNATLSINRSNSYVINNVISGTGRLLQAGSGTTTLSGVNTFTGPVSINAGTLRLMLGSGGFPSLTGDTTINSGGTLLLGQGDVIGDTRAVTVNGGAFNLGGFDDSMGVLTLISGTITGGTVRGTAYNLQSGDVSVVLANRAGVGITLTKDTTNTVTLTQANTYSGGTVINAGTLRLNGGTLGGGNVTNNATLVSGGAGSMTLSNNISGTGALVQDGSSVTILSGSNPFSGAVTINNGQLQLTNVGAVANASGVAFGPSNTPTLELNSPVNSGIFSVNGGLNGGTNARVRLGTVFNNGATLAINVAANTTATFAGVMSEAGGMALSFTKNGAGTQVLSGSNTFQGQTIVNAGTLALGASERIRDNVGLIINGGTFDLGGFSETVGYVTLASGSIANGTLVNANLNGPYDVRSGAASAVLGGSVGLAKTTTDTAVLSGNNTYSGVTTISSGTLQVGNSGTTGSLGSGAVTNNATLVVNRSNAYTLGNTISGTGALVHNGSGVTTLTAANTFSGGTVVNAGTLALLTSNVNVLTGTVTVNAGATLQAGGNNVLGDTAVLTLNGGTYALGSNGEYIGAITMNGNASVTGSTGIGGGQFILTAGQPGDSTMKLLTATGSNNLIGVNIGISSQWGGVGGNSNLKFNVVNTSDSLTVSGVIADKSFDGGGNATSGALTKSGQGTLTLAGDNTYSGGITIEAGVVQVGNGGTTGNITGNSAAIANRGTIIINRANGFGLGNAISGTGSLVQIGSGTTFLSGSNSFTGGTVINAGTLLATANNRLADTGAVTVDGGAYDLGGFSETVGAVTLAGGAINNGTLTGSSYAVQSGSIAATLAGAGGLTKSGPGTVTLTGSNSYSGITTISGGTLQVGTGGTTGSLGPGNVTNNAALVFNRSGSLTVGATISGTGGVTNAGSGTLTLTGSNTYSGGTVVSAGRLVGTTASLQGPIANNATVEFTQTVSGTYSGALTGSGALAKTGTGTLVLVGSNASTGSITISSGTLQVGSGGASGSLGSGAVTNNGTLAFNRTGSVAVSGAISGSGGLVQQGPGTLVLTGSSTYAGPTIISAGTLRSIGEGLLPSGTVTIGPAGTLVLGGNQSLASISGSGSIDLGNGTLTTGSWSGTFAGSMTGNGGFTKVGLGTLTLTGSSSFTGDTTLTAGTLVLASTGALPTDAVVTMQSGATLQLSSTTVLGAIENNGGTVTGGTLVASLVATQSGALDSVIADGQVNGTPFAAGILKRTAGTTTVGAVNTFTGAIRLQGGMLQLTGSGAFDPASRLVMSSGATMNLNGKSQTFSALSGTGGTVALGSGQLTVNNAASGVFAGVISGSGGVVKTGAGFLELTGASTYSGPTAINAGELKLNGSLASSALALAAGATLSGTGSFSGDATIAGAHTPGNSPGIQSIGGNLTYSAGASVTWELADNTAALADRGIDFDGINVGGNLAFTGTSLLNLAFNGAGSVVNWNDSFWTTDKTGANGWLVYDATGSTTGLSGLAINGTDWLDGAGNSLLAIRPDASFALQQVGSDVYLTFVAVPEPSSIVLVGCTLAGLALARRRRQDGLKPACPSIDIQ